MENSNEPKKSKSTVTKVSELAICPTPFMSSDPARLVVAQWDADGQPPGPGALGEEGESVHICSLMCCWHMSNGLLHDFLPSTSVCCQSSPEGCWLQGPGFLQAHYHHCLPIQQCTALQQPFPVSSAVSPGSL